MLAALIGISKFQRLFSQPMVNKIGNKNVFSLCFRCIVSCLLLLESNLISTFFPLRQICKFLSVGCFYSVGNSSRWNPHFLTFDEHHHVIGFKHLAIFALQKRSKCFVLKIVTDEESTTYIMMLFFVREVYTHLVRLNLTRTNARRAT